MKRILASIIVIVLVTGCSPQQQQALNSAGLQNVASGLFGSTPGGSYVDTNSLFTAGQKLSSAAKGFSEEEEYYLGRSVSASILGKYPLLRRKIPAEYITKVGRALASHSDRPDLFNGYRFGILDSNEINAMSTPGGFIFVSRGLLKLMPDEDSLAAVLAHEIAHVVKGHGVKAISSSNMRGALLILGQEAVASQGSYDVQALTNAFGSSVTDVADTLMENGYSRSQEYEADEYATELMRRAGYNDKALITMLEAVEKSGQESGGWFDTHPSPSRRIGEAESHIGKTVATVEEAQKLRAKRFQSAMKVLS